MRLLLLVCCALLACSLVFAQTAASPASDETLAQLSAAQNTQATGTLGSVSGQVVQDPSGAPLRKVLVVLASSTRRDFARFEGREPEHGLSATTDSEGHFEIDAVPAGDYRVQLAKGGYVLGGRRSQQDSPTLVTVGAGQQLDGLLFRLIPAGVVRGKISDEDGDPLQNVTVFAVLTSSRNPLSTGLTNDLGEYRMAGLPSGKYLIVAQAGQSFPAARTKNDQGNVYALTFFPGTSDGGQAATVEIRPGEEAEASFPLVVTKTFAVRGQVPSLAVARRNSENSSGAGSVMLRRADSPWSPPFAAEVRKDGSFEISGVAPGTYAASVTSADGGSWQPARGSDVIEVRGADVNGVQLSPEPRGEVRGRFRMDDNQPFNWAQLNVYLQPDESGESNADLFVQVTKDGGFKVENVPAANYHVVVTANSNNLRDYYIKEVNVNGKDAGDTGFAAGPGTTMVDIVASAKGSAIVGTVVDGDNKTVSDVNVICVPDEPRRKRSDVYQQARADSRGQFSLRGLNPGDYTVFVLEGEIGDITDPDFVQAHQGSGEQIHLDEGEQKTITLKFSWDSP